MRRTITGISSNISTSTRRSSSSSSSSNSSRSSSGSTSISIIGTSTSTSKCTRSTSSSNNNNISDISSSSSRSIGKKDGPPSPFSAIPGPKPSLPFIGTNWIYFPIIGYYQSMKLHEANLDKYRRYGPIMKEEYQPGYPSVTLFDPSDFRKIFQCEKQSSCPTRPVLPYVIKHRQSDPTRYPNVGLANMMGKEWYELRSMLAPLLLSKELKRRHIGAQNRVSTRLVNYIKNRLPDTHCHNQQHQQQQQQQHHHQHQLSQSTDITLDPNDTFKGGVITNIQEVFYRFSMESIMNLCINQQLGCLSATGNSSDSKFNEVLNDGELIFEAAMRFFEAQHKLYYGLSLWKYFDTKPYRQLVDSQNAIHDIASKYIDVALDDLKKRRGSSLTSDDREEHESLIETLCSTNRFNDLEIKNTIVDFINGGIYTVANTLTMALFLLAANPNVQEQLYQEICKVFKEETEIGSDITIDMKKIDQLTFLKQCLKESHRLLPTIPGIARTLQEDLVLSNYLVPKKTLVFCNFMVTCRLPQYFEDPDTFNPTRWERIDNSTVTGSNGSNPNGNGSSKCTRKMDGGNEKKKDDLAFSVLPFGHGVRKCIGHNFAELEIYVALAKLIRSFKVTTVNNQNTDTLELSYKFIVVPEKPVNLRFTPRCERAN